jgi:TRAP-type mannitol/chloroaromatic compound transport system permease small subunit
VRGLAAARVLSAIFGLIFFGLIVWGSYEPMVYAFTNGEYEGEGALRVPVWPARVIILLGSALVVLTYLELGISAMGRLISGEAEPDRHPELPL